jgi:hypothetical protein
MKKKVYCENCKHWKFYPEKFAYLVIPIGLLFFLVGIKIGIIMSVITIVGGILALVFDGEAKCEKTYCKEIIKSTPKYQIIEKIKVDCDVLNKDNNCRFYKEVLRK